MPRTLSRQVALIFCAGGLLTAAANGQESQRTLNNIMRTVEGEQTFTPRVDTGLTLWERAQFEYGGSLGYSYLSLNQAGGNSVALLQPNLTIYGRVNLDGAQTVFARADFNYQHFSPGDSFDGRGNTWSQPVFDRYWYEFDLRRAMDVYHQESIQWDLNVRAGRQFVEWASGLALSEAVDGGKATLEFDARNRLDGLVGITPEHTADFDSSRQNYDTYTKRVYYGALFAHTFEKGDEAYAYALGMGDHTSEGNSTVGGLTNVSFEREGWYLGAGAKGAIGEHWLYNTEAVYLTGHSSSDPLLGPQQSERLFAWAGRLQFTYAVADESDTRYQAEVLVASGDPDRRSSTNTVGGNEPGTDDKGFVALGYAFTGVAFAPAFSNLVTLRVGGATFPARSSATFGEMQVGADWITSFKYSRTGAIDEPTNAESYLGTEFDVYVNWRVSSDLSLTTRYGIFFPGAAIPEPDNCRNFIYVGVTLAF